MILVLTSRAPFRASCTATPCRSVGGVATVLLGALSRWTQEARVHWMSADGGVSGFQSFEAQRWSQEGVEVEGQAFRLPDWPNQWIWPLWHGLPLERRWDAQADFELLRFQEDVQRVGRSLLSRVKGAQVFLIQDYQWAFLPRVLRTLAREQGHRLPPLSLFWHLPWPRGLRASPLVSEVVLGLLGVDFLGFQTEEFLGAFCDSVLELLGPEALLHDSRQRVWGVRVSAERTVRLGVCPVSCYRPGETERAGGRPRRNERKILIGVDRVDPSKGLLERLEAYDLFLEQNPAWRQRVTWWEFGSPSRLTLSSYRSLLLAVEARVQRLQARWGKEVVRFWLKAHRPERLQQAYAQADVAWVTSVADGMNLVGAEYVLARGVEPGELILSETVGAAAYLKSATQVPARAPAAWARALRECLERGEEERAERWWSLRREARARSAEDWGEELLFRTLGVRGAVNPITTLTDSVPSDPRARHKRREREGRRLRGVGGGRTRVL